MIIQCAGFLLTWSNWTKLQGKDVRAIHPAVSSDNLAKGPGMRELDLDHFGGIPNFIVGRIGKVAVWRLVCPRFRS
ncbi:unannotated protein [freshwater metagenome]|uniref:Unannotated protein n=1 Tax=freshwater metagenome TaxID=449393 RepID=A0A6J7H701_9ZZZZ